MRQIISIIVVVVVLLIKFFAYKYFGDKKVAKQVEDSKTHWSEEYKSAYLKNCIAPMEGDDPTLDREKFCPCFMEKTEKSGLIPTMYDPELYTVEKYDEMVQKIEADYLKSDLGLKNADDCSAIARK